MVRIFSTCGLISISDVFALSISVETVARDLERNNFGSNVFSIAFPSESFARTISFSSSSPSAAPPP